jgi:hypothetical protein
VGQTPDLPAALPSQLPDVSSWEQSWGEVDFGEPSGTLVYRLYVDPDRNGVYGVTYYRIRIRDPEARRRAGVSDSPKLQWIIEAREVRRFECEPVTAPSGDDLCEWREHERGSAAYQAELGTVLRIYALHRDLLRARDHGALGGN